MVLLKVNITTCLQFILRLGSRVSVEEINEKNVSKWINVTLLKDGKECVERKKLPPLPLILEAFGGYYIWCEATMSGRLNSLEAITMWVNLVMIRRGGKLTDNEEIMTLINNIHPFERVTNMESQMFCYPNVSTE